MEQVIAGILEKTLVGGAFLYLLYKFTSDFSVSQKDIVKGLTQIAGGMTKMSKTLVDVSTSLHNLDDRVKKLEEERK